MFRRVGSLWRGAWLSLALASCASHSNRLESDPGTGGGGSGGTQNLASGGSSGSSTDGGSVASGGSIADSRGGTNPTGGNVATGGTLTGGTGGLDDPGIPLDAEGGAPGGPSSSRLTAIAKGTDGATHGYWEYLPPHYGNGAPFPLLVFLHGKGEWGSGSIDSLQGILGYGIPKLLNQDAWPEDRAFVVLSLQHEDDQCVTPNDIATFTSFALEHYQVNPKRVYLTGLSCGGIGIWNYLGEHFDETVAAVVPIAGDGRDAFELVGCELGRVPIWAFHGDADLMVEPAGSSETIANLQACTSPAATEAKITVYPGGDHNSWDRTYDLSAGNDIYTWLLGHKKP